jgi:hypothetical protein
MADQIVSWGGFDSKGTNGMGITGSLSVDGSTFISSSNATQLQVGDNSLFVSGSGDIGVGTTTPSYKLDVSGSGNFTNNLTVTGSLTVSGSSTLTNIGPAVFSGSLVVTEGITGSLFGTSSYALTASYLEGYVDPFPYTGSAEITGSLGITGSLNITGSSTITGFVSLTGRNNNFIIASGSGASITTGSGSLFIGNNAGSSVTTGNGNLLIGNDAGRSTTNGYENLFIGTNAGRSNIGGTNTNPNSGGPGGYGNTFIGIEAGFSNTNGRTNDFIGYKAGNSNIAIGGDTLFAGNGSFNVAIGDEAGRRIANGNNNTGPINNSVFIGRDTRANAANQTNFIVIGYQAVGLGSNTTVIGNSSTTRTHLFGNLSLGTTSAISARLNVRGSGATSATTALRVENSAGTARLTILDDGTSAFNTNALYVSGSGRVGLGTTAPTQLLDVRGRIIVTKTLSLGPQHGIGSNTTLEVYANGTPAELMIHEDSGSSVASLYFRRGGEDQRIIANERGLEFNLEGGGGTTTMTLEHQTHNVAIGQQSPTARLHVKGSGTTSATTALLVENSSAQAALTIKDDKTATFGGDIFTANGSTLSGSFGSSGGDYIRIHGLNYGGQAKFASYDYGTYRTAEIAFGSGDIHWRGLYKLSTNGYYLTDSVGSLGLFERFTVDYLGRVGISNPNPSYRLDVSGSGNFTNNLTVTGSATISSILTLIPQDPLPAGSPTGSFAISSSVPPKPYFYDGTVWNALY